MSNPAPSKPLDIGPGPLKGPNDSPFLLSNDDWTAIDRYFRPVFGTEDLASLQQAVNLATSSGDDVLAGFREAGKLMYNEYDLWSKTTFPTILTLVGDIAAFGRQCGVAYEKLEGKSVAILADRASALAQQSDSASGLSNAFLAAVRTDKPNIQANFALSMRRWNLARLPALQNVEGLFEQFAQDVLTNSGRFQQSLGLMVGAWQGIASDLRDVAEILSNAGQDDALVLPFDLELARKGWSSLAQAAEALVQNAPRF